AELPRVVADLGDDEVIDRADLLEVVRDARDELAHLVADLRARLELLADEVVVPRGERVPAREGRDLEKRDRLAEARHRGLGLERLDVAPTPAPRHRSRVIVDRLLGLEIETLLVEVELLVGGRAQDEDFLIDRHGSLERDHAPEVVAE